MKNFNGKGRAIGTAVLSFVVFVSILFGDSTSEPHDEVSFAVFILLILCVAGYYFIKSMEEIFK
jgi:hypothetical protein